MILTVEYALVVGLEALAIRSDVAVVGAGDLVVNHVL